MVGHTSTNAVHPEESPDWRELSDGPSGPTIKAWPFLSYLPGCLGLHRVPRNRKTLNSQQQMSPGTNQPACKRRTATVEEVRADRRRMAVEPAIRIAPADRVLRSGNCLIWLASWRCGGTNALRGPHWPIRTTLHFRERRHMISAKDQWFRSGKVHP